MATPTIGDSPLWYNVPTYRGDTVKLSGTTYQLKPADFVEQVAYVCLIDEEKTH